MKINNVRYTERFRSEEAAVLINLFFDQIMGKEALNTLTQLISFCSTHAKDRPDRGLANRANELAANPDSPLLLSSPILLPYR